MTGPGVYQGDCLEVMPGIADGSVDFIFADLPYGLTACHWDSCIPLEPLWEQLRRILKPTGIIAMTSIQPFTTTLISSNMKMFKYEWIWDRVNSVVGHLRAKKAPLRVFEEVLIFGRKPGTYNPQMVPGEMHNPGGRLSTANKVYNKKGGECIHTHTGAMRYPKNILQFKRCAGRKDETKGKSVLHSTQKPVALIEYLIRTYTNPGELVVDPCMGAGSTGVAAKLTGRAFIGIELDPKYFDIAAKRIEDEVPPDTSSTIDNSGQRG